MKNLENYGVLEMNANEIKEINGGTFPPINPGGLIFTAKFLANEVSDFMDGFNLYYSL